MVLGRKPTAIAFMMPACVLSTENSGISCSTDKASSVKPGRGKINAEYRLFPGVRPMRRKEAQNSSATKNGDRSELRRQTKASAAWISLFMPYGILSCSRAAEGPAPLGFD